MPAWIMNLSTSTILRPIATVSIDMFQEFKVEWLLISSNCRWNVIISVLRLYLPEERKGYDNTLHSSCHLLIVITFLNF